MDNSLKDRVLDAADIVEVIGERVTLTRKGREFVGLCPFHPDHTPSLNVSPTKRIYKCFSCGAGGDVITFVQKTERVEFREALAQLAQRAGISLTPESAASDRRSAALRNDLQSVIAWAREHFHRNLNETPAGVQARAYALQRGLSADTIEVCGLGFAADAWDDVVNAARRRGIRPELLQQAGLTASNERGRVYDRFRNRLIFPITDALGRPIAFGGRTLADDPAKYLNSPETPLFSKSRVLYGLDRARDEIRKKDAVIVVEGYMDAVLVSQYGFRNVVATLGTAMTDAHVKLLRPMARRLDLCFDSDQAGVRAAERAVEVALRTQTDVRVVVLEGDKDPADCVVSSGAAGFENQLTRARDALEFKWAQALKGFVHNDPRGRRAAIEEFVRFVAGVVVAGGVDPIQQDLLVGRLGSLLGVPAEEVFELLSRAKRQVRRPVGTADGSTGDLSSYDAAIRGLPGGLIAAVETLLGLLATNNECWRWVDEAVARGGELSEPWRRLYRVLLAVHEDIGQYSIGDIVARCEDSALCELLGRARERAGGSAEVAETFNAARERLASELDLFAQADLEDESGSGYAELARRRRGHASALSAQSRRKAGSPGPGRVAPG